MKSGAAQRATNIKPSAESNRLLGEALKVNAPSAQQSQADDLRQRAERAFRTAIASTKNPSAQLYYDLADVLEDRGMNSDAEANFQRAFDLGNGTNGSDIAVASIRGLVRTSYALKKTAASESWFALLVNKGAANAWDWQQEGDRLYAQEKYGEAGNAYRNAATHNGQWRNWCRAAASFWHVSNDDTLATARECISGGTGEKDSEAALSAAHQIIATILNQRGFTRKR